MATYPNYFTEGGRDLVLGEIYGTLVENLQDDRADLNESYRDVLDRTRNNRSMFRSNTVDFTRNLRQGGNASTAARGNSNS